MPSLLIRKYQVLAVSYKAVFMKRFTAAFTMFLSVIWNLKQNCLNWDGPDLIRA